MKTFAVAHVAAGLTAILQDRADDGLTLIEIITNIPHDVDAFVIYAMTFGAGLLVWRFGRSKPRPPAD